MNTVEQSQPVATPKKLALAQAAFREFHARCPQEVDLFQNAIASVAGHPQLILP